MLPEEVSVVLSTIDVPFSEPKELVIAPKVCGIYLLILGGEVVYVGQSTDIVGRINCHVEQREKAFDKVVYIECAEPDLNRIEHILTTTISPRHNRAKWRPGVTDWASVWQAVEDSITTIVSRGEAGTPCAELPGGWGTVKVRQLCRDPRVRWDQSRAVFVPQAD